MRNGAGLRVAEAVAETRMQGGYLVIDAVRTPEQINAMRQGGPVLHVHLSADSDVRRRRFLERADLGRFERDAFDALALNPTEHNVEQLAPLAEVCLRTDALSVAAVRDAVLAAAQDDLPGSAL